MSSLAAEVEEAIVHQFHALRTRVQKSLLYTHEVDEFRIAHQAYRQLVDRLGVVEDLGSLTTVESRNLVRKVHLGGDQVAVLKLIGNTREPGEGEVLAAWRARGLPCAEPLAWGYERVAAGARTRTAAFLLTRFIEHDAVDEGDAPLQKERRVDTLVRFMRQFHRAGASVSGSRRWDYRLGLHLRWTLPHIRRHGLPEPAHWLEKLRRVSKDGQTLIHGDPAGGNVLVAGSDLVLLDPPGALQAMREADVGQICSQVGGVGHVVAMVDVACDADRTLMPDAVACFAGLNFLTWAGYFLAGHHHPDAVGGGGDPEAEAAVEPAKRYLDVADRLLDQFVLDEA